MAEEKLFTQEEVNKLVGQARLEGKDAGRKEYEGWISPDELAKQKDELSKQVEGLNEQIKALTDEQTSLKTQLTGMVGSYSGVWSIYICDLATGEDFVIHDNPM